MRTSLTLGPLLFNWSPDAARAFYREIAENAEVDRVYLGEVVCGKRAPLLAAALGDSAEMLTFAGKEVIWSSPALPATPRERRGARDLIGMGGRVELNDISGLAHLAQDQPFVAGPLLNIYNEAAAAELVRRGCDRLCLNIELSLASIEAIHRSRPQLQLELFAYGRIPLALSGRCYHARLHGLHKDSCQFVCDRDPDGREVRTIEGAGFLALNGVMTMSQGVQAPDVPMDRLREAGVTALRLSPQTGDFLGVIQAFRRFADGELSPQDLAAQLPASARPGPLVSGYLAGAAGMRPLQHA